MTVRSRPGAILAHAELPSACEDAHIMVMPAPIPSVRTIADLRALPDDGMRHELLDGVHVVTPSPALPHQAVLREIEARLLGILEGHQELELFWSPADIVLGARTLVQPDLFVVRKQPGQILRSWTEVGVPVLAVEVLSPGTAARDRGIKRTIYQRAGVGEYWIVDLDARLVERWRPDDARPEILTGVLIWQPSTDMPELSIELASLFLRVLGPEN
jgi:Uma2 family endonuclease